MKSNSLANLLLATALFAGVSAMTPPTVSAQTNFTGSYSQNFDAALTNSGTALPPGFTSMVIAGANSTYTASSPITAAGIAAATADTQSLTVWNVGTAVTDSGSKSFNIGCWDTLNDRALGTDLTGTAAQVMPAQFHRGHDHEQRPGEHHFCHAADQQRRDVFPLGR